MCSNRSAKTRPFLHQIRSGVGVEGWSVIRLPLVLPPPVRPVPRLHRPVGEPGPQHGPAGQRRPGRDPRPAAVLHEEPRGRAAAGALLLAAAGPQPAHLSSSLHTPPSPFKPFPSPSSLTSLPPPLFVALKWAGPGSWTTCRSAFLPPVVAPDSPAAAPPPFNND